NLGSGTPTFEKDITRVGPVITLGGTVLPNFLGIPEESVLRPGEISLDKDTLTARRKQAAIDNGYNAFAKLVTGLDDVVFSDLSPQEKTRVLILSSLANQEMEKGALMHAMQSVTPQYGSESDDYFAISSVEDQARRSLDISRNPDGGFTIRGSSDIPSNVISFPNGSMTMLDTTRSGMSSSFALTISGTEMDRLSGLDWSLTLDWKPEEGTLPPEYQTTFSEYRVAGEMRLFREE
ncbi:MAG: hypothetical protein FWF99_07165, partial [Desulfovibrionaceae bacterium]|nr:hypothetical protein [Desulfovibrionaceae bacterium]